MPELHVPDDDISRWHAAIAPELRAAFEDVLAGPRFTLGPNLRAFETEFAAYCGSHASIGISSGTAALHLALLALGVGPGDEVITVPNTYIATAFAIHTGALPVFVDVDPLTLNMNPAAIGPALTERTKAILPVHMYGQCADVAAIRRAAPGIPVLEDAAHAHGATLGDRHAGSLADLAAFSFYPTKVLGALGDGGAIAASTPELEARVRQLRYMGQKVKFDHAILGYQERLDEMQAAFLRVKLRYLDEQVAGRVGPDPAARFRRDKDVAVTTSPAARVASTLRTRSGRARRAPRQAPDRHHGHLPAARHAGRRLREPAMAVRADSGCGEPA
jgi:dTDP-4-amino-4,6-dideoxygalactose transaminase